MRFPMPKTITKLLLLIGMVAFFFPFVMVSCSGESMELSGFELMTSISLRDEMENEEEGEDPNPYLAVERSHLEPRGLSGEVKSMTYWFHALSLRLALCSLSYFVSPFGNFTS